MMKSLYQSTRSVYGRILNTIFEKQNKKYLESGWKQDFANFCKLINQNPEDIISDIGKIDQTLLEFHVEKNGKCLESFYIVGSIRYLLEAKGCQNILEIGTGLGINTALMAQIAPSSKIYTCDLPTEDPAYQDSFFVLRKRDQNAFDTNISYLNIKTILKNSMYLFSEDLPNSFDLIWLDGGHHFPAVAWDFAYCYSRLRKGGILLMDDYVVEEERRNPITRKLPDSISDVEDLCNYISRRINETIHIFPRYPLAQKYVAMIIKD